MWARMLYDQLDRLGIKLGRRLIGKLMKQMGIAAVYREPDISKKQPGHRISPHLPRALTINRAN